MLFYSTHFKLVLLRYLWRILCANCSVPAKKDKAPLIKSRSQPTWQPSCKPVYKQALGFQTHTRLPCATKKQYSNLCSSTFFASYLGMHSYPFQPFTIENRNSALVRLKPFLKIYGFFNLSHNILLRCHTQMKHRKDKMA